MKFDNISPLDFRYRNEKVVNYLSENAFIRYMAKVELALVKALAKHNVCSEEVVQEVENVIGMITAESVYKEEERMKHLVRALVNMIREKVSDKAKPFIHLSATSNDIICSADAARFKDFTNNVLVPGLIELEKVLIEIALREKESLQIGRTHGRHSEPISFGFFMAEYVSRLGKRIVEIKKKGNDLRGKLSGAVGAYNAQALLVENVLDFEKDVLEYLGLKPSEMSTQIVEAEYLVDFIHSIVSCFGVLANLCDDMRHLQRSEINEIFEEFKDEQVGSSTMPHKRNPISFENIKSMWKEFMPRMNTLYMDQISEHQRDLTNSGSMRFVPEILAGLFVCVERLTQVMSKIKVDKDNLKRNFAKSKEFVISEPLYVLLSLHGCLDAHEKVRKLTLEAEGSVKSFSELVFKDEELMPFIAKFSQEQVEMLKNPEKYVGISFEKTEKVCEFWKKELV